jgi:hypothetical protein
MSQIERIGAAIEEAWNGSGSDEHPNKLPPIDLSERERCHLGRAAFAVVTDQLARAERDRSYAIRWANQSVDMLKDAFFPVADALRGLELYLRDTPHHNALEAAAARKALTRFDAPENVAFCAQLGSRGWAALDLLTKMLKWDGSFHLECDRDEARRLIDGPYTAEVANADPS